MHDLLYLARRLVCAHEPDLLAFEHEHDLVSNTETERFAKLSRDNDSTALG